MRQNKASKNKASESQVGDLSWILEMSLNEIYIFDSSKLLFLWANKEALKNTGYTIEELCKLTPLDIKPDYTWKSFTDLIQPLLSDLRTKVIFDTMHRRRDGSYYDVELHLQMGDYMGQSVFVAIVLDVSEKKLLEERRLRRIERRLRRIERVKKELDVIVELSKERSIPDGNLERFLVHTTKLVADTMKVSRVGVWFLENKGKNICCHVFYDRELGKHSEGPCMDSANYPNYFNVLTSGRVIAVGDACNDPRTMEFTEDYLIPLGIGSLLHAPIRVADEIVGMLCLEYYGIVREWKSDEIAFAGQVSDQVSLSLASHERQQAEELLQVRQRAIDAVVNGVVITDPTLPDNPIIYVNPAMEQITGYSSKEVLGMNCRFLQSGNVDQNEIRKLRLALKDEREITVVLQNYRKDGTPFWNELTVSPVFNKKGELINFVGIQRDITEHLEAETARKKLELEIVRIADEERQLIALDLHDGLGSYLSGLALICKAHSRSLSLEGSSASHKADEICNLMGGAVTQLREVARGLYPIKETGIGLMDALNDLVARTSSDQVNCFFDCISPVLLYDSTVANHLYHIAQEVVTNALKYSQADEIIINLSKVNKKVCLSITDNGIGVGTVELKESDGIGLRTIAYRVRLIEGELKIHNKTDTRGTEIICYCYLT